MSTGAVGGKLLVNLVNKRVRVGTPPRVLAAGLSLQLREGERWAIIGANGSGKSTIARLLGKSIGSSADEALDGQRAEL